MRPPIRSRWPFRLAAFLASALLQSGAQPIDNSRQPDNEAELEFWLRSMLARHGYTLEEAQRVLGLPAEEIAKASAPILRDPKPPESTDSGARLRVLPYPGGRHPRLGFFEGAVAPQRETKLSVFPPWPDAGYVVVDAPEAIFSNLGLTYLAHTHIPTIWDEQGVSLRRLEWEPTPDGGWTIQRCLPNGIEFGATALPRSDGVAFVLWLSNGTSAPLTDLRVQNCVMLGAAQGFSAQSLTNKVFDAPFAAAVSATGRRWVITAWENCGRAWGNERVPCVHSDPRFPDCAPGEKVSLRGWLSFHEGPDVRAELARLKSLGIP